MTGMNDLIIGQEYTLTFKVVKEGVRQVIKKKMILMGKYKHHAVFMQKGGFMVSYTYWELKRLLNGIVMD